MKVILEASEQQRLTELLNRLPNCEIVEEEKHTGQYNATNFILRYRPSRKKSSPVLSDQGFLNVMQKRGLSPDEAGRAFVEFVRSGEEDILLEIILSTYQEMLESEIGRCMHEDRIIEQRLCRRYRGPLTENIQYLLEYLFALPDFGQARSG